MQPEPAHVQHDPAHARAQLLDGLGAGEAARRPDGLQAFEPRGLEQRVDGLPRALLEQAAEARDGRGGAGLEGGVHKADADRRCPAGGHAALVGLGELVEVADQLAIAAAAHVVGHRACTTAARNSRQSGDRRAELVRLGSELGLVGTPPEEVVQQREGREIDATRVEHRGALLSGSGSVAKSFAHRTGSTLRRPEWASR